MSIPTATESPKSLVKPAKLPEPWHYSQVFGKPELNLGANVRFQVAYTALTANNHPHEGQVGISIICGFSRFEAILTPAQCREAAAEMVRIADLADARNLAARGQ